MLCYLLVMTSSFFYELSKGQPTLASQPFPFQKDASGPEALELLYPSLLYRRKGANLTGLAEFLGPLIPRGLYCGGDKKRGLGGWEVESIPW